MAIAARRAVRKTAEAVAGDPAVEVADDLLEREAGRQQIDRRRLRHHRLRDRRAVVESGEERPDRERDRGGRRRAQAGRAGCRAKTTSAIGASSTPSARVRMASPASRPNTRAAVGRRASTSSAARRGHRNQNVSMPPIETTSSVGLTRIASAAAAPTSGAPVSRRTSLRRGAPPPRTRSRWRAPPPSPGRRAASSRSAVSQST